MLLWTLASEIVTGLNCEASSSAVRSGLLANSIVSELITRQTLLEAWNLCIHANWQVKTDERMIHWCRCQTSHLAMQHLRATALWNKWLDISFPTSNNYPSILILLAQQILKGKKKQKKRTKKWRNRAKEYILLIIIQWSAYKKFPACKLGAAVGFERRHGVRWNGGGRAVHFPVPIGSSTLSTDHTDNFLSDVHEPIIAWKDTAQKQEYWLKFEVPSGSNFCEKPTVATTISITGSCNKEHVRGSSWFFGSMTKLQ